MNRLPITKTPKVYVGGAFIRSESGRTFAMKDAAGEFLRQHPAVHAQGPAQRGRGRRQGRPGLGEAHALQPRADPLPPRRDARGAQRRDGRGARCWAGRRRRPRPREVAAAVDRLIYYAGWADKYEQVLGSVNPVAAPYFNFTVTEPMGIVGVIAPEEAPLLGLVSLLAPGDRERQHRRGAGVGGAAVSGDRARRDAGHERPAGRRGQPAHRPAPGTRADLRHARPPARAGGRGGRRGAQDARARRVESVKRTKFWKAEEQTDWFSESAQSLYCIRDFLEFKTTWHPIGA